jgi:hypothetical protein
MRLGDCVIETELGSVDLGIRSQLGEIERGFFDRAGGGRAPARSTPGKAGWRAGRIMPMRPPGRRDSRCWTATLPA